MVALHVQGSTTPRQSSLRECSLKLESRLGGVHPWLVWSLVCGIKEAGVFHRELAFGGACQAEESTGWEEGRMG